MPKSTLIFQFGSIFVLPGICTCQPRLQTSHRPDGIFTYGLRLQGGGVAVYGGTVTIASSTISGNTAAYVRTRAQNFPSPDGKLTFCSFFAGRWCPCRGWHSVNRELQDLLQHSFLCARSSSKVPIAPMGDSRFDRCSQGGGVFVVDGTVTIASCTISGNTATYVRAHTQNLPSPHVVKRFSCQPCTK
jgi:hypothetical protein